MENEIGAQEASTPAPRFRTLCIYDSTTLDGLLSAAIIRYWYETIHKDDSFIWIKDLDCHPELNDPSQVLEFKKYTGKEFGGLYNYHLIIMCGIRPSDRYIYHILESKANVVWITNQVDKDKDPWLIHGKRNINFSNSELTWMYYMEDRQFPKLRAQSMLGMAHDFLLTKL